MGEGESHAAKLRRLAAIHFSGQEPQHGDLLRAAQRIEVLEAEVESKRRLMQDMRDRMATLRRERDEARRQKGAE